MKPDDAPPPQTHVLQLPERVVETVDSTNSLARRYAADHPAHGLVFRARFQEAGRGRFGRTWQAAPDTAMLSSMVIHQDRTPLGGRALTVLAACACVAAIERLADHTPPMAIHWPNDVTLGGRKVAGVLVEECDGVDGRYWIVGLGLNVRQAPPLPEATCCNEALQVNWTVDEVAREVYRQADRLLNACADGNTTTLATLLHDHCTLVGKTIEAHQDGVLHHGKVVSLEADGTLVLQHEGTRVTLAPQRTTGCRQVD